MKQETLIDKYISSNAFGRIVGMHFKIVAPGIVEYHLKITKDHLATPLSAHGGLISALVDGALGTAGLSSVYQDNKVVSTVEYKVNFLSPALLNDELVAHAKVEQKGNRILIVSCDVLCITRENVMIAKALGTFNAYDATKAGF